MPKPTLETQRPSNYLNWLAKLATLRREPITNYTTDPTYDYELFYNQQPNEAQDMLNKDSDAHFTDIGKTSSHPTFSNESYYSGRKSKKNPRGIIGGKWSESNGNQRYTLSQSQLNNNWDIGKTIEYLNDFEDYGVQLKLPNGRSPIINGIRYDGVLPNVTVYGRRSNKSKRKK